MFEKLIPPYSLSNAQMLAIIYNNLIGKPLGQDTPELLISEVIIYYIGDAGYDVRLQALSPVNDNDFIWRSLYNYLAEIPKS